MRGCSNENIPIRRHPDAHPAGAAVAGGSGHRITRRPMNVAADLDTFLKRHREHGHMTPTVGEPTPIGHRLETAWPGGVPFTRPGATPDAVAEPPRQRRSAGRTWRVQGMRPAG